MAIAEPHGGNCCGMTHIHGFRDGPADNVESLRELTEAERGNRAHQLEVILSDRQTRENPVLLEELARLGYTYSSSWTGSHGTPVHLFLRAKRRLALSASHFYGRWAQDLQGMVANPNLSGDLPNIPQFYQQPNNRRDNRALGGGFLVGDRVVIRSPYSRHDGREATILGIAQVRHTGRGLRSMTASLDILDRTGRNVQIVLRNLRLVQPAEEIGREEPAAPELVYRHPNNPAIQLAQNGQERRLILSQFYCIFRGTGLPSRVFGSLEEGQEAYPRALDWHERRIYSDGEVAEGPVNHG